MTPARRHIVHLIYRFDTGGLENVVVQLINNLPQDEFRHTVVAITVAVPAYAQRIQREGVEVISLGKGPGQPFWLYPKFFKLLRRLKPDVLHTCNLSALEFMPVAALAGVPRRIHAEHGMDTSELSGKGPSYLALRRFFKYFVQEQVAVSESLRDYLRSRVGVDPAHVHHIPNGVDTQQFRPRQAGDLLPEGYPFTPGQHWVMGTVGRQVDIKNPLLLVDAFIALMRSGEPGAEQLRLAMVGTGPLADAIRARLHDAGMQSLAWLPGGRSDVAHILRALDCFVLPSLSEATSCTLQEAMATGLPIVATDVGGNADLLAHGNCGSLVPTGDVHALAAQIRQHWHYGSSNPQAIAAQAMVHQRYSLNTTLQHYRRLFLK
ncbi:TIGR03088 family PEP-CTERM/XrtA system glycosyltransferase [Rhodoferax sp. 4810]|nr:TIGR03088 family PEP-CTERM/XrtA system glycosyltransferase [Rhodoferax jenense]